jgi:glycosyltransferase involved in cell wall biosynthesis
MTLRAYKSALNQTHADVEIVIVDNGSSLENLTIMESMGLVWLSAPEKGAGAARMVGLSHAAGENLVFLDSDDELLPEALTSLLQVLGEGVDLAYGGIRNVNETDSKILHQRRSKPAPLSSCSMVRGIALEKFGGFTADNFSWARWYLLAKDRGLSEKATTEIVALRYIHGENLSTTENSYSQFFALIREKIARRGAVE